MTTTDPMTSRDTNCLTGDSIKAALFQLEALLNQTDVTAASPKHYAALGEILRRLHARVRLHHAESQLSTGESTAPIPPEWLDELKRLSEEHSCILGMCDRIVRCIDSMADRPVEDRDVCIARIRELVAVLRRHECEEDRLFTLAMWRDTGGES